MNLDQFSLNTINEAIASARDSGQSLQSFELPPDFGGLSRSERLRVNKFVQDVLSRHSESLLDVDGEHLVAVGREGVLAREGDRAFEAEVVINQVAAIQPKALSKEPPSEREQILEGEYGAEYDRSESFVFSGFAKAHSPDEVRQAFNENKLVELPAFNEMAAIIPMMEESGASFNLQAVCDDTAGIFSVTGLPEHGGQFLLYLEPEGPNSNPSIFAVDSNSAIVQIDGRYFLAPAHSSWDFTPTRDIERSSPLTKGMNNISALQGMTNQIESDEEIINQRKQSSSLINLGGLIPKKTNPRTPSPKPTMAYLDAQLDKAMDSFRELSSAQSFNPASDAAARFREAMENLGGTVSAFEKAPRVFADDSFKEFIERYEQFSNEVGRYQADLKAKGSAILSGGKELFDTSALKEMAKAMERTLSAVASVLGRGR